VQESPKDKYEEALELGTSVVPGFLGLFHALELHPASWFSRPLPPQAFFDEESCRPAWLLPSFRSRRFLDLDVESNKSGSSGAANRRDFDFCRGNFRFVSHQTTGFSTIHHTDPRAHQRLAVIYMISIGA
jgi:hypothetical protein